MTDLLLSKGAKINEKNTDVIPALSKIKAAGNKELCEFLSSRIGNNKTSDGFTPFFVSTMVILYGNVAALEMNESDDPEEIAKLLVAKGADINKGFYGITPLHLAVLDSNHGFAEYLISKGADVNARDNNGSTPLHIAASNNDMYMAEFLISKGANLRIKDNMGLTPADNAIMKEAKDFLSLQGKQ
jgi:ankyrin repeat protein